MNVTTMNLGRWVGICATSAMLVAMVATIPGCGTIGRVGAELTYRFPGGEFHIFGEVEWGPRLRRLPPAPTSWVGSSSGESG